MQEMQQTLNNKEIIITALEGEKADLLQEAMAAQGNQAALKNEVTRLSNFVAQLQAQVSALIGI